MFTRTEGWVLTQPEHRCAIIRTRERTHAPLFASLAGDTGRSLVREEARAYFRHGSRDLPHGSLLLRCLNAQVCTLLSRRRHVRHVTARWHEFGVCQKLWRAGTQSLLKQVLFLGQSTSKT
eukprot:793682-Pleurochrysis_carterae.AAC.3